MATVVDQPTHTSMARTSQDWSTGMFECLEDVPSCCFAYWCCPCFACMTSRDFGEHLCLPLLDVFGFCVPPITLAMRISVRHRYGILGTIPMDCVWSSFCSICTWCQMAREIKIREGKPVKFSFST